MAGTEAKIERERIAAARRATKPRVTQAHVDALMAVMTPEGRAAVALQAVHRLRVAPSLPWMKW
jgi:hypothetical protein